MLKAKAHQKLSTLKLSTNLAVMIIIKALSINRKKPKLKIVAGMVNKISIGLRKIFNNDKTIATKIAVI
jgi:hypothetical protein